MSKYCYDQLKFHVPYNTYTSLPFYTKTDLFPTKKYLKRIATSYYYFAEILQFLVVLTGWLVIPTLKELPDLCNAVSPCLFTTHIVLKGYHLYFNRKRYLIQLQELQEIINGYNYIKVPKFNLKFDDHYNKKTRVFKIMMKCQLIMQILMLGAYFFPYFYNFVVLPTDQLNLPLVAYSPINTTTPFNYLITLLFDVFTIYIIDTKIIAADFFVLNIIVLHTSQIEFMNELLSSILSSEQQGLLNTEQREKCITLWIKQHQRIIMTTIKFRKVIGSFLIITYSMMVSQTCVCAVVMMNSENYQFYQKVSVFGVVGSLVFIFYLYAGAGNDFSNSMMKLETSFHSLQITTWPKLGLAFKMYSCFHHKPFYLNYYSLFPLCHQFFLIVMKLMVTYYMALTEIQRRKGIS